MGGLCGKTRTQRVQEWCDNFHPEEKGKKKNNIFVFLNPNSGSKDAKSIYEEVVKPMFKTAGFNVDCVMTKSKEHCISIGKALHTKSYDAIIAISGDGGFIDLLMGMAQNCDHEDEFFKEILKFNFGLIPAGSSNSVACTMGYQHNGKYETDVIEATSRITNRILNNEFIYSDIYSVAKEKSNFKDMIWDFIGCHTGAIAEMDLFNESCRSFPPWLKDITGPLYVLWNLKSSRCIVEGEVKLAENIKNKYWDSAMHKYCMNYKKLNKDGWFELPKREFAFLTLVNTEVLESDFHMTPGIELGDGCLGLMACEPVGLCTAIPFLLSVNGGNHLKQYDDLLFKIPIEEIRFKTNLRLDISGNNFEKKS